MSSGFDGVGGPNGAPAPESSTTDSLVPGIPDTGQPAPGSAAFDAPASNSMAEYTPAHAAYVAADPDAGQSRFRRGFRNWRQTRPFWGGLLVLLSGAEMTATEKVPMRVVLHLGMEGLAGIALPIVLVLIGLLLWLSPSQRLFYSVLAVLVSLATWITSNLGGFVIGMLLGLIGGSMAFAWAPERHRKAKPEPTEG